jgi:hypothetical protein
VKFVVSVCVALGLLAGTNFTLLIVMRISANWWNGFNEETFRHIGQWGVLMGAVILFGPTRAQQQQRQHQQQHQAATIPTAEATTES